MSPRLGEGEGDGSHGMRVSRDEKSTPSTLVGAATGHKRSTSGSLMSKLSFLRPSSESRLTTSEESVGHDAASSGNVKNTSTSQPKKGRSRKGSLRKTALLGTSRLKLDRRNIEQEQMISPSRESKSRLAPSKEDIDRAATLRLPPESKIATQSDATTTASTEPTLMENESDFNPYLPQRNRRSTLDNVSASAISDEDILPNPNTASPTNPPSGDSYFPPVSPNLPRHQAIAIGAHPKSPLAVATVTLPLEPLSPTQDWDYSETEWWGWVILAMTWGVFVMGMGSCFGVWSWAWDVGQTPYAPPELEDDPTLPIVGYYPALIILTGVMAWVWVVVAWVGMKYFRHAKMQ